MYQPPSQSQGYGQGYGGFGQGHQGYQNHGQNYNQAQEEKRPMVRRTVDYGTPYAMWMRDRCAETRRVIRNEVNDIINLYPPLAYLPNGAMAFPVKHAHTSANKARRVINVVRYTPHGRRLLTGSTTGEFTLWNGAVFNFELLNQAHDTAIRCMEWTRDGEWLISGDGSGIIKYWQSNLNNVKVIQAHDMECRDVAFSPTGNKFVSASDDSTLKVWNFNEGRQERVCSGHGWDVRCVDWHPSKGLILSGSKDNTVKLWDPRTAQCISTLHDHKNSVMQCAFQPAFGSNLFATCSRDSTAIVFDLRKMQDLYTLRGHEEDVTSLCWNPVQQDVITTGGGDGSLNHYCLRDSPKASQEAFLHSEVYRRYQKSRSGMRQHGTGISHTPNTLYPAASVPYAHELAIWSVQYHPVGHILCSGSNDKTTRFWCRARPHDEAQFHDRYYVGENGSHVTNQQQHRRPDDVYEMENEHDSYYSRMRRGETAPGASFPGLAPPSMPAMPDHLRQFAEAEADHSSAHALPGLGDVNKDSSYTSALPGL